MSFETLKQYHFGRLKLKIVLAFPDLNEQKMGLKKSSGQGLIIQTMKCKSNKNNRICKNPSWPSHQYEEYMSVYNLYNNSPG